MLAVQGPLRLSRLDPAARDVIHYEPDHLGELVHVDVNKRGRVEPCAARSQLLSSTVWFDGGSTAPTHEECATPTRSRRSRSLHENAVLRARRRVAPMIAAPNATRPAAT